MKFKKAVADTNRAFVSANKKGFIHIKDTLIKNGECFFVLIAMFLTVVLYPVAIIIRMVKK